MKLTQEKLTQGHLEANKELWLRIQNTRQKQKQHFYSKPLAWAALIPLLGAIYFFAPLNQPSDSDSNTQAINDENLYLEFYQDVESTELSYVDDFYLNL